MSQEYSLRSLEFTCNIYMSHLPRAPFHNRPNQNFINFCCVHEPACLKELMAAISSDWSHLLTHLGNKSGP